MKAKVYITLKPGILDPQGQAIRHALESLGFDHVQDVRTGKFIEMSYNGLGREETERQTRQACEKLLANPVIENYEFVIVGEGID
jgi:phosphoribosylformylglycinamidine synthase